MIYQFHIPRFPLDQFVEVFVYFSDVSLAHNFDRFLPNGDTEILIDFHDTPQFIYDNSSLKEIQACNTSGRRACGPSRSQFRRAISPR